MINYKVNDLFLRGSYYKSVGAYSKAINYYYDVIDIEPNNIAALLEIAVLIFRLQEILLKKDFQPDAEKMIGLCNRVLEINNKNEDAYYWMGIAQYHSNQSEAALASLRKSEKLGQEFARFFIEDNYKETEL